MILVCNQVANMIDLQLHLCVCRRMFSWAAGTTPGGVQQATTWCLRAPFTQKTPLPLPCPYLMSSHHNRYLLAQNQVIDHISSLV
jgi:hypothetical protein